MNLNYTKKEPFFPRVGWTIDQSIEYAISSAKQRHIALEMEINDVSLTVCPNSKADTVKNLYLRLLNTKNQKTK